MDSTAFINLPTQHQAVLTLAALIVAVFGPMVIAGLKKLWASVMSKEEGEFPATPASVLLNIGAVYALCGWLAPETDPQSRVLLGSLTFTGGHLVHRGAKWAKKKVSSGQPKSSFAQSILLLFLLPVALVGTGHAQGFEAVGSIGYGWLATDGAKPVSVTSLGFTAPIVAKQESGYRLVTTPTVLMPDTTAYGHIENVAYLARLALMNEKTFWSEQRVVIDPEAPDSLRYDGYEWRVYFGLGGATYTVMSAGSKTFGAVGLELGGEYDDITLKFGCDIIFSESTDVLTVQGAEVPVVVDRDKIYHTRLTLCTWF